MSLKWGIIGMGDIADKVMAPAMHSASDHELIAIMRRNEYELSQLAEKHGIQKTYTRVEDILNDSDIDAVYIATPVNAHKDQTIQAAQKGKHILCEKPMAMNPSESNEMINACSTNNVGLMLCYYQRFNKRHQKIRELIQRNEIGQITAVRLNNSGFLPDSPDSWRQDPAISGGGNIMDVGSHCVDLLRYLFGDVLSVNALVNTLAFQYEVDDTATMLLELTDSVHAVVSTHWSTLIPRSEEASVLSIYGTEGTIISTPMADKFSKGSLKVFKNNQETEYKYESSTHVQMLDAFAVGLENENHMPISGTDGLIVSKVIDAAYRSALEGKRVMI